MRTFILGAIAILLGWSPSTLAETPRVERVTKEVDQRAIKSNKIDKSFAAKGLGFSPTPAWVDTLSVDIPTQSKVQTGEERGVWLLRDAQVRVKKGSRQDFFYRVMTPIRSQSDLKEFSHLEFEYDPTYQTLDLHQVTIHRQGRRLSRLDESRVKIIQREERLDYKIYDGSLSAVLFIEDLRIGDVLEYRFTRRGANPIIAGRFLYWHSFTSHWTTRLCRLRLLWPKKRKLNIKNHGLLISPQQFDRGPYREYVWQQRDLAAKIYVDELPYHALWSKGVQLSEFSSWSEVARWGDQLFRVKKTQSKELKQLAHKIKREHKSPVQRFLAAVRFVQDEIRYLGLEHGTRSHRPSPPAKVLARRFGDCKDKSLLLVHLLGRLHIKAWPVLVNTGLGRGVQKLLPSAYAFNHTIIQASVEGQRVWVDPTQDHQRGDLEHLCKPDYGLGLVLLNQSDKLQRLDSQCPYNVDYKLVFDLAHPTQQTADLRVMTTFEGRAADRYRNRISTKASKQLTKDSLNYYARTYPSIEVQKPIEVIDDIQNNRLTLIETYHIPEAWSLSNDGEELAFEIYPTDFRSFVNQPQSPKRKQALGVHHPLNVTHQTEVRLPEEWDLNDQDESIDDPSFRFHARARLKKPSLILKLFGDKQDRHIFVKEFAFSSKKDRVERSELPTYQKHLDQIHDTLGYRFWYNMDLLDEVHFCDQTIKIDQPTVSCHRPGVSNLAPLKFMKQLKVLDLSFSGVRELGPLAQMPSLRRLNLKATPVKELSDLESHPNLEMLSVEQSAVGDLSPIKDNANLQSVFLFGSRVSQDQINLLRKERPALTLFARRSVKPVWLLGENLQAAIGPSLADQTLSTPATKLLEQGLQLAQTEQTQEAQQTFHRLVQQHPNATTFFARGVFLGQLDGWVPAIEDFTKAIELQPNHKGAYLYRGRAYMFTGNQTRALLDVQKALELDPADYRPHLQRCQLRATTKDFESALQDCLQAISCDPEVSLSYRILGDAYQQKGDLDKAQKSYTHALERMDKSVKAYVGRGFASVRLGLSEQAISDLTRAIALEPEYHFRYEQRGMIYQEIKDYESAHRDYEKAISLQPSSNLALNNLAWLKCHDMGQCGTDVLSLAQQAVKLHPRSASHRDTLAYVLCQQGDKNGAAEEYQMSCKLGYKANCEKKCGQ